MLSLHSVYRSYTCRSLDIVNSLVLILDNGICCKSLYLGCICLQEGIIEQCMSHYTLGWVAGCACVLWSYWERHNHCSSYVSFSFCGFTSVLILRFSWQSLTRRWLRRRRFGTDVHNLPFPIQEQPQEAWMSKISQESNVYLVKTTYIINPVIKSCDGNNGFILINQLDCLKKQMSTYHLFFITYQLFICTLFD